MKTVKVGDLNFGRYKTEVLATDYVKKRLDKDNISHSNLIPAAWFWYDSILLPELDENGDGKPDKKFGNNFQLIYFLNGAEARELEQKAIIMSDINIKGINIKYAGIKNAKN